MFPDTLQKQAACIPEAVRRRSDANRLPWAVDCSLRPDTESTVSRLTCLRARTQHNPAPVDAVETRSQSRPAQFEIRESLPAGQSCPDIPGRRHACAFPSRRFYRDALRI